VLVLPVLVLPAPVPPVLTAPAGATADSATIEPAVPAASKIATRRRLDRITGFKV
jgi:hypothetical protein